MIKKKYKNSKADPAAQRNGGRGTGKDGARCVCVHQITSSSTDDSSGGLLVLLLPWRSLVSIRRLLGLALPCPFHVEAALFARPKAAKFAGRVVVRWKPGPFTSQLSRPPGFQLIGGRAPFCGGRRGGTDDGMPGKANTSVRTALDLKNNIYCNYHSNNLLRLRFYNNYLLQLSKKI